MKTFAASILSTAVLANCKCQANLVWPTDSHQEALRTHGNERILDTGLGAHLKDTLRKRVYKRAGAVLAVGSVIVCSFLLVSEKSEPNPISIAYLGIDGVDRLDALHSEENFCISNRTEKTYGVMFFVDIKRNGTWDKSSMGFVPGVARLGPHSSTNWGTYPKLDANTYPNQPWRFRVVALEQLSGYRAVIAWLKFFGRRTRMGVNPLGPYQTSLKMYGPAIELMLPVFNEASQETKVPTRKPLPPPPPTGHL